VDARSLHKVIDHYILDGGHERLALSVRQLRAPRPLAILFEHDDPARVGRLVADDEHLRRFLPSPAVDAPMISCSASRYIRHAVRDGICKSPEVLEFW
jgi:hypothetical protein